MRKPCCWYKRRRNKIIIRLRLARKCETIYERINQLALTCNGPYIAQTEVKAALKKERDNHKHATLVPVDLSGSLKEIETRIIKHVMIQEEMNQVKVEKRLEIGHSTLWRKLK